MAKYFAIIPAMFAGTFPVLNALNIMQLNTPQRAMLSAVIFNALIIVALIPLALRGVKYRPMGAASCCAVTSGFTASAASSSHSWDQAHRHAHYPNWTGIGDCHEENLHHRGNLMTIVTTILLGIIYPLVVTGLAQAIFPHKANGQLIGKNGKLVGSRVIGQPFSGPAYFHSRPSAAGAGYDAANSGGTNLGPTNQKLIDRVDAVPKALQAENPGRRCPSILVTTSASGLDPDISTSAAEFQVPRIARERGMSATQVRELVATHTEGRQFGFLGEPRVNVLELNMALDAAGH